MPATPSGSSIPSGQPNTLNITNNTSFENSVIAVYVIGKDPQNGTFSYLGQDGKLTPLSSSPAPKLTLAAQPTTNFPLPYMNSARIYFAINGTLSFTLNGNGPTQPAGWVPTDPSYSVLHDFVEFDYGVNSGLYANTTQVDMFSIPILLQLGTPGSPSVGVEAGLRSSIFSAIKALGGDYAKLIVSNNGMDLRVIAPGFNIENNGGFSPTYFDTYVTSVWAYYQTNTMTLDTNGFGTWSGKVTGDTFVFTQAGQTSVSIAKPITVDVFQCSGPFASSASPAAGRINALIAAGLNRGTLLKNATQQPDFNVADFYVAPPANLYAKVIHDNTIAGKAYGFAYDDEGGFSSMIGSTTPTSLNVTLSAF